jgi:hypothetical protein
MIKSPRVAVMLTFLDLLSKNTAGPLVASLTAEFTHVLPEVMVRNENSTESRTECVRSLFIDCTQTREPKTGEQEGYIRHKSFCVSPRSARDLGAAVSPHENYSIQSSP